jgi:hypothetical protein
MNPSNLIVPVVAGANRPLPVRKKCSFVWILLALLLTLCAARADGPDDDYLAIYGVIAQADTLNASGQTSQAHAKYIEAERALVAFQRVNPAWKVNVVSYRLKYLVEKVAATSGPAVAPGATATAVTKQAISAPKSPVKLLDAGSEPRIVLRLHPAVGDKQTLSMTMKMAMTMSAADKQMPAMPMPAMLMTMDIGVKDISADGGIGYEMVLTDATVVTNDSTPPAMAAAMKSSLAGLRGMTGVGRMSASGIINHLEMKMPAGADPGLSQMMDQMKESFSGSSNPLPEEAVGPGAKWEYKTQIKSQGMTIDQTATYELVSIAGDRLTLRSTIAQNAADQKIQNPAMPGLKTDLVKMTGTGTGGSTLDLAHIMPMSGTLDEDVEVVMGENVGQQKQTMDMKMNMNVTLETK